MSIEIRVPQMGESITEGTIADWHKQAGDSFESGDILVEIETDKVTMEVPAPVAGTLKEILKQSGDDVAINDLLAIIEEGVSAAPKTDAPKAEPETKTPENTAASKADETTNKTLPPGAARLAAQNNLDPSTIEGTGLRGQVRKADVVHHLEQKTSPTNAPVANRAPIDNAQRETIKPMSRLRQKIAERLVQAQQEAAILTTFNEVDMSNVMALRSKYKDIFKEKYGVGLGFMSFFAKACVEALRENPAVNAQIRGTDIVYQNFYDIGVAVGGPKGLVVPVVKNVDQLSFWEFESELLRLALKVKDNQIALEDLMGGTFTISNGGIYGSMMSTPILNPPQSGILGMHNIVKRAVVIDDEIKIRPMMYVALSYDHRIIDGKEAVTFLVKLKDCVENPERMLLNI